VAADLDRRFSASPASTAREIFEALQADYPGVYADKLLRTFQRRLKTWRHEHAKALVFGATAGNPRLQHAAEKLEPQSIHNGDFRHSSDGENSRRDGCELVKNASFARVAEGDASHS